MLPVLQRHLVKAMPLREMSDLKVVLVRIRQKESANSLRK